MRTIALKDLDARLDRAEMEGERGGQSDFQLLLSTIVVEINSEGRATEEINPGELRMMPVAPRILTAGVKPITVAAVPMPIPSTGNTNTRGFFKAGPGHLPEEMAGGRTNAPLRVGGRPPCRDDRESRGRARH